MLRILTGANEIKEATREYFETVTSGLKPITRIIGWKGGSEETDLYWRPQYGYWVSRKDSHNRHWFAYGTKNPHLIKNPSITCEINIPKNAIDNKVAGAFAKDERGNLFLTHSGKIGGGKKGVGKSGFLNVYQGGDPEVFYYSDNNLIKEAFLIGKVGGKYFFRNLSNFIKEVDRCKDILTGKSVIKEVNTNSESNKNDVDGFSPEFEGEKKYKNPERVIEAKCDHGNVVKALYDVFTSHGLRAANDGRKDLYVFDENNEEICIVEVKTDPSTTSVYQAIGQLVFHSSTVPTCRNLIAVFPEAPKGRTKEVFDKIGIRLIKYRMTKAGAEILNPNMLIKAALAG